MTQTKTAQQALTSLRLLDEAERHLENDDLYKACEKGLEAMNHYLRTVGEQRGWAADTERDMCDIATDLAYETSDRREASSRYLSATGGFAIKFYGEHHTSWQVAAGIGSARELISRLEDRDRPPPKVRPSQISRERQRLWNLEQKNKLVNSDRRFGAFRKRRSLLIDTMMDYDAS